MLGLATQTGGRAGGFPGKAGVLKGSKRSFQLPENSEPVVGQEDTVLSCARGDLGVTSGRIYLEKG